MADRLRLPVAIACLALTIVAAQVLPAHADAIDGSWCNEEGENLNIDGPAIVTPGGHSITGSYSRHAFSYVSPAGEKYEGDTLDMSLHSDELMSMRLPDGTIQSWRRCEVISFDGPLQRAGRDA